MSMPSLRWPSALGPNPDRMRPLTGQMNLPVPAALTWAAVATPRSIEGPAGVLGGGAVGAGVARATTAGGAAGGVAGGGDGGGDGGLVRIGSEGVASGGLT